MSTIRRFEDLLAWREARDLVRAVYRVSQSGAFSRDQSLRDQVRRAAISVLSNIAEGFERNGDREFRQFLSQAKGSAGELRAQLYVAVDQGYLGAADFDRLRGSAERVSRLLSGFLHYLGRSGLRGSKFRSAEDTPDPEADSSLPP